MKKVIVTGSSGRIGSAIVDALKENYQVTGVDRISGSNTHVQCDILDREKMFASFQGCDAVFHCAAYHAPHVGEVNEEEFRRVNIEGTRLMAQLARECKLSKFIFTSTTALYGKASQLDGVASWITEETTPIPKTIYHRTKLESEKFLEDFANDSGIKTTSIRMSRCFPEPANLMAIYRIHRGIDKRDVASAHRLAYEVEYGSMFETFIVSGETPLQKEDCSGLFHKASDVLQLRAPKLFKLLSERKYEVVRSIDRVYCSHKAQRMLGWRPRFGFDEVFSQLDAHSQEVLDPIVEGESLHEVED